MFLKILQYSEEKNLCWILFLIKLHVYNFPVKIDKFLRTAFP